MAGKVYSSGAAAIAAQKADRARMLKEVIIPAEWDSARRTMRLVVQDSPVDQGEYKSAWEIRRTTGGHPHLANDAPYAGVIELGARPHWPPFAPIYEWALRKAGDLALGGMFKIGSQAFRKDAEGFLNYRGQRSLDQDDRDEVYRFARAVQAKIAREGSPPRYIMRNRLDDAQRFLAEAVQTRLAAFAAKTGTMGKA